MASFSNFCAAPGLAVPGAMRPGLPVTTQVPVPPGTLPQVTTVTIFVTQVFSIAGLTGAAGLRVINQGPAAVWAGGSSVAAVPAGGLLLGTGQSMFLSGPAQNLWAVTASGAATVLASTAQESAVV